MKRVVLIIVSALIFGVMFTSCGSDNSEPEDGKITGDLYVFGAKSTTDSAEDDMDLLFTGDDIKSLTTACEAYDLVYCDAFIGEIVFSDLRADDIMYSMGGLYTTLYIYIDETLVFDPPITIYRSYSSYVPEDLHISIYGKDKFILSEWYRTFEYDDWLSAVEKEAKRKEQDETFKMRKKQLDVFFKYLSDHGKLVQ